MNGCETEWKKTLEGGGRRAGEGEGDGKKRKKRRRGQGEEREEEIKSSP